MKKKQLLTLALAVAVLLSTIGFSVKAFASIAETPSRIVTADWELADAIQEANPGDTIGIDGYFVYSTSYTWNYGDAEKQVYIKRMNPDSRLIFQGKANLQNLIFDGDCLSGSSFIVFQSNATIQNCTFQNIGGGIACSAGEQTFEGCTFDNNNDGCINIEWGAYKTTFTNCTFINNTNTFMGGGAIRNEGDLTLDSCLFTGNACIDDGGAIFNYHLLTITNSKIYGNTADGNPSDIATRINEAEGVGISFTDDSEALNALFVDDGYTVEWQTETINSDKYGNYTKYTLQLTEMPGEEEPEEPTEPETPEEPSEPEEPEQPTEPTEPTEPEQPTEPGTEEPSTPSEPTEPTQPEQPSEPATPSEPDKKDEPSTPTDSGKSDSGSNTPSGGGTSSSSSNPSSDSSNSFRIDEPLGNVENNINIDNPSQYPSEIHISGNLGGSGGNQGNIPLQQTINVGSQEQPSEASTESGDKNITLSLNLGDAAELGSAFLLFKAAMLAIIFGVFAMLGIVVITILKKK